MPLKCKTYDNVIFSADVIIKAHEKFLKAIPKNKRKCTLPEYSIATNVDSWCYNNKDEFFSEYRKEFESASIHEVYANKGIIIFNIEVNHSKFIGTLVRISLPERKQVEAVFGIFEQNVDSFKIPAPPSVPLSKRIKIFIGHGRSSDWRDLKDHLHEKHKFEVIAYEIGTRAGLSIKEVLEKMLTESSFALLVLTPEDEDKEGKFHARQNVIHELGLFQGRLGFKRAIAVVSEKVEEFSNIHGLNQILYSNGNIKESFGEVLATIKREFGEE